jgi:hypothetical protein
MKVQTFLKKYNAGVSVEKLLNEYLDTIGLRIKQVNRLEYDHYECYWDCLDYLENSILGISDNFYNSLKKKSDQINNKLKELNNDI